MFFYLSKVVWWFLDPGNLIFFLISAGVLFLLFNKKKIGTFFCSCGLLVFVVLGVFPVGAYMLQQLENRFPQVTELPRDIDGIIVLGGMLNVWTSAQRNTPALNSNVERVTSLLTLRHTYSGKPIVFSGGAGLLGYPDLNESTIIRPVLKEIAGETNPLIFENKSRNTYENAKFTKAMLGEKAKGRWLLVTSARHIPRAVACFRAQKIDVVPYPVDYSTGVDDKLNLVWNVRSGINKFQTALHEWLGLFAYYLTDKTSELFPSP